MVLVTVASIVFQASFFTKARLAHLTDVEIPTELQKLALEVSLQLEPSIQTSRLMANDTALYTQLSQSDAATRLQLISDKILSAKEGIAASSLFVATNLPNDHSYYQYNQGRLQHRNLSTSNTDDAWYYNFVSSKATYELHLDTNTFSGDALQLFVNYRSAQLNSAGQPRLVAGVALEMQALSDLISQYRIGDKGLISLVTQTGDVQINAEQSILPSVQNQAFFNQLLDNAAMDVHEVAYRGEQYFFSSIWIDSLKRWLVIEIPKAELIQPINTQMKAALGIGLGLLALALALIYPVARSLTRPLHVVQMQLQQITQNLDLTHRIQINDKAELGELANQVNLFLDRVQLAIQHILSSSGRLNDSATQLAYTAGLVHKNTDLQAQVSQSMAAAIEQMSSSVAEITATMEELSASSTQIADHSQSVVDVANQTLNSSKKGAQAMQGLEQRMIGIHTDYEQSVQEILELGNQSKEISKVMDLINTVAAQTKLIAFNAALEASSAGESGKRFSVVAGEIRRLADSVTDSTSSIEERIQAIQSAISRLVITSEKAVSSVQAGMEVSAETAQELNDLVQAATRTSNAAQQISLSTQQQKTASNQVVAALHDIANASSTNAQSVRQITDISEDMLSMAHQLNQLVLEFKVEPAAEKEEPA